jgi:hypothetical protein
MSDRAWIIIAALFAGASVLLYLITEIAKPLLRYVKLRDPIDFHFVVTKRAWAELSHVIQDDDEHRTKDMVYPSHSPNIYMQLQFLVKISFRQTHLSVNFSGDQDKCP